MVTIAEIVAEFGSSSETYSFFRRYALVNEEHRIVRRLNFTGTLRWFIAWLTRQPRVYYYYGHSYTAADALHAGWERGYVGYAKFTALKPRATFKTTLRGLTTELRP